MTHENINYNKMFEENAVVENVETPEKVTRIGTVVNCDRLRVRQEPTIDAPVVKEITKGAEVMVDFETSTDDFYSVVTESGSEGFCMKKFVTVN